MPPTPYVQPGTGAPSPPAFNFANSESSTMAYFETLPFKNYTPPTTPYVYPR